MCHDFANVSPSVQFQGETFSALRVYDKGMRLGVLDIGSNTVHLLVVDAKARVRPDPFLDQRSVVRLMQYMDDEGHISDEGVDALVAAIRRAVIFARDSKVDQLMGIITSAIREAPNGDEVMKILEDEAGTTFKVLSGNEEAELTFLAARRWHGWAAGRLMVLDIGGGSFEVAVGIDEEPEFVASIPLGAGRLTKLFLDQELPTRDQIQGAAQVREAAHGSPGRSDPAAGAPRPRGRHIKDFPLPSPPGRPAGSGCWPRRTATHGAQRPQRLGRSVGSNTCICANRASRDHA